MLKKTSHFLQTYSTPIGCAILAFTAVWLWLRAQRLQRLGFSCPGTTCEAFHARFFYLILISGAAGLLLASYFLYPLASSARDRLAQRWRKPFTIGALLAACVALSTFIISFGNHQFGAFDFSLLIDVGWRLYSGQVPYRDFVCTLPPGFYLPITFAYKLFGVQWNSILYITVIFTCTTFLWLYALLSQLLQTRTTAFFIAICAETAAMLTTSYWWYNSITSITATIFLLSSLVLLRLPERAASQISYCAALGLLGLMKPNIAGPLIVVSVVVLLLATPTRLRFALLSIIGAGATLLLLAANQISITDMIASYRAAATDRGVSTLGFRDLDAWDLRRAGGLLIALLIPFAAWLTQARGAGRKESIGPLAAQALILMAPVLGTFAMFTNMELKDVDWPIIFCGGSVVIWGKRLASQGPGIAWWLPRVYAALLCAVLMSDLYMGAQRFRVQNIGYRSFFEWSDADRSPGVPYLRDFTGSRRLHNTISQVEEILVTHSAPIFFGPRMEFCYAAFGIPSPLHLPVWWHPGTSFATVDEGVILRRWAEHRFATLVFLKDDYTYYSDRFQNLIASRYIRDDRWPDVTVFVLRPVATDLNGDMRQRAPLNSQSRGAAFVREGREVVGERLPSPRTYEDWRPTTAAGQTPGSSRTSDSFQRTFRYWSSAAASPTRFEPWKCRSTSTCHTSGHDMARAVTIRSWSIPSSPEPWGSWVETARGT